MRSLFLLTVWLCLVLATLSSAGAQGPSITVTSPTAGEVLQGNEVAVSFTISGFNVIPSTVPLAEAGKRPEANQPGEGHIHLMLDLQPVVVWERDEPYTFTDVPPGEHQLMVELVNNDHSSLNPPVIQQIRFRTAVMLPETGTPAGSFAQHMLLILAIVTLVAAGSVVLRKQRE
jgi:hypothetical protein